MTAVPLIAALCLGAPGSQTVEDDFESGTLLVTDIPPGPWNAQVFDGGGVIVVGTAAAAAHRGGWGLRINALSPAVPADQAFLQFSVMPTVTAGDYYLREWVRVSPAGGSGGTLEFAQLAGTMGELAGVQYGDGIPIDMGNWYLVESYLLGLGSGTAVSAVYVNGALQGVGMVPPTAGQQVAGVWVGLTQVLDGGLSGPIDFDDVRSSLTAPASTLAFVTDGGTFPPLNCFPFTLELLASDGTAASMPYDAGVFINVQAVAGQFFSGNTCVTQVTTVDFVEGQSAAPVAFRALVPGTAMLTAMHPDFLSGSTTLTIQSSSPDGGPPTDGGFPDAGGSAGDGGTTLPDAGPPDGGHTLPDGGLPDAGESADAGALDAGGTVADAGESDAGIPDAGLLDGGAPRDAGPGAPGQYAVGCGCGAETGGIWAVLLFALASCFLKRRQRTGNA